MLPSAVADETELARSLTARLGQHIKAILGKSVDLTAPSHSRDIALPAGTYVARLDSRGTPSAWFAMDLDAAIVAAGLMLQRPQARIDERAESRTFDGDDFDALGELVNQLTAPLNEVMEAIGGGVHLTFAHGKIDGTETPSVEGPLALVSRFDVEGKTVGSLRFIVSRPGSEERSDDAPAPNAGSDLGVDLTDEEIQALREAARDAARTGAEGKALVIVPVAREHAAWKEQLAGMDLEHAITADVLGSLSALRSGEFNAVIIDADSTSCGGVTVLRRIRSVASTTPVVVVASAPTRRHLVACLAAGANRYLAKPANLPAIFDEIQRTSST